MAATLSRGGVAVVIVYPLWGVAGSRVESEQAVGWSCPTWWDVWKGGCYERSVGDGNNERQSKYSSAPLPFSFYCRRLYAFAVCAYNERLVREGDGKFGDCGLEAS